VASNTAKRPRRRHRKAWPTRPHRRVDVGTRSRDDENAAHSPAQRLGEALLATDRLPEQQTGASSVKNPDGERLTGRARCVPCGGKGLWIFDPLTVIEKLFL
jgi:hypothetical protein